MINAFTFSKKISIRRVPTINKDSFTSFKTNILRFPISSEHIGHFNLLINNNPTNLFFSIEIDDENDLSISLNVDTLISIKKSNSFFYHDKVLKALNKKKAALLLDELDAIPINHSRFSFNNDLFILDNSDPDIPVSINTYLPTISLNDFNFKFNFLLDKFFKSQKSVLLYDKKTERKFKLTVLDNRSLRSENKLYLFTENEDIFDILYLLHDFLKK